MATSSIPPSGTPDELLSASRDLTRRVRSVQRAAWFPLLLFAALFLPAVLIDRYGHYARTCRTLEVDGQAGRVCAVYSNWSFAYWPVALLLAYVVIAGYYFRRSSRRGVGTRVRPYVVVGVIFAMVFTGVSLWGAHHPPIGPQDILGLHLDAGSSITMFFYRLPGPASAIGFALLVLAWVERSPLLAVFSVGYLAIVLWPVNFGWVIAHPSPWFFLPRLVVPSLVLLLGGVAFAVAHGPAHGGRAR